jgi:hypothetical protein
MACVLSPWMLFYRECAPSEVSRMFVTEQWTGTNVEIRPLRRDFEVPLACPLSARSTQSQVQRPSLDADEDGGPEFTGG